MGQDVETTIGKGIRIKKSDFIDIINKKYNIDLDNMIELKELIDYDNNGKYTVASKFDCYYDYEDYDYNSVINEDKYDDEDDEDDVHHESGINHYGYVIFMLRKNYFNNDFGMIGAIEVPNDFIQSLTITKDDIKLCSALCKHCGFKKQVPSVYIKNRYSQ